MVLRHPTEALRVALDQNGNATVNNQPRPAGGPVVDAEDADVGALAGTYRRVQIYTPQLPGVMMSLTTPPHDAGPSRTGYQYAPLPPESVVELRLQPQQVLFLASEQGGGPAICTVVIEYCEGEP